MIGALPIKNMLHLLSFYLYENKAMQDSINQQHLIAILYLYLQVISLRTHTYMYAIKVQNQYLKNQ